MNIAGVTIAGASIGLSVRLRAIALAAASETPPTPESDCSEEDREASEKDAWLALYREPSEMALFLQQKQHLLEHPIPPIVGALVRVQVLARQHLENPITIFLPDGSQGRVWLATDKPPRSSAMSFIGG